MSPLLMKKVRFQFLFELFQAIGQLTNVMRQRVPESRSRDGEAPLTKIHGAELRDYEVVSGSRPEMLTTCDGGSRNA